MIMRPFSFRDAPNFLIPLLISFTPSCSLSTDVPRPHHFLRVHRHPTNFFYTSQIPFNYLASHGYILLPLRFRFTTRIRSKLIIPAGATRARVSTFINHERHGITESLKRDGNCKISVNRGAIQSLIYLFTELLLASKISRMNYDRPATKISPGYWRNFFKLCQVFARREFRESRFSLAFYLPSIRLPFVREIFDSLETSNILSRDLSFR